MSVLTEVFAQARTVLEVPGEADIAAVKRAYRKKAVEHPPDQDPEGFRRIRECYEVLLNPLPTAKERLFHPMPHAKPPSIPQSQAPTEPVTHMVLRQMVASLTAEQLESYLAMIGPGKSGSP